MFNGHRGINHPVKNMVTGRAEVTSQNHGFGVIPEETINKAEIEITHVNLNDQSIEGISVKNKKAFSVQYHPEALFLYNIIPKLHPALMMHGIFSTTS